VTQPLSATGPAWQLLTVLAEDVTPSAFLLTRVDVGGETMYTAVSAARGRAVPPVGGGFLDGGKGGVGFV
jgi:hypothetical protein